MVVRATSVLADKSAITTAIPYGVSTMGKTMRHAATIGPAGNGSGGTARAGSYCSINCFNATRKKIFRHLE